MADGLLHSQDIKIQSCKIVTSAGKPLEIKDIVIEFNYYEDIFNNGISGSLVINDSMAYIKTYQIQGNEVLILSIDKPGFDNPLEKNFRIYNIPNRNVAKPTNETYIISFCSEELYLNEQYKLSKSYPDSKIIDIVKDIAFNSLKIDQKEFIDFDDTTGLRSLVIPNFKPIQAINWLCTFAMSADKGNIGSPFVFYENRYGFHFRSLLNLFQQPAYRLYQYDEKNLNSGNDLTKDINKDFVSVIEYEFISTFNSVEAVKQGMYSNKTYTIDPLRLKFGEKTFDYSEYTKEAASLEKNTMPISATNRFGDTVNQTAGVHKFCISSTGQSENKYIKDKKITINENLVEQTVSARAAQLAMLCSNRVKILVPGDIELAVGKVVEFNMPTTVYTDKTKQKKPDEFNSGKYLITALRHIVNQQNNFYTCLELSKESFPSKFNNFDNSDPGWKGVR